jgi:AcrR family transcriptional regulator
LVLFSQAGYDAAGVAEICQAAGVSKGAFYHHFPTKQAVFLEILHSWLSLLDTQMDFVVQQAKTVPLALLNMAGSLQGVFQQSSNYLPMFLEFWTQASHDPAIWREVIAPYRRYQEYFKAMLQQGIDEGSLRNEDTEVTSRLLVALAVGLLLQSVLDSADADWSQVPRQSIQVLLDGLATAHSTEQTI